MPPPPRRRRRRRRCEAPPLPPPPPPLDPRPRLLLRPSHHRRRRSHQILRRLARRSLLRSPQRRTSRRYPPIRVSRSRRLQDGLGGSFRILRFRGSEIDRGRRRRGYDVRSDGGGRGGRDGVLFVFGGIALSIGDAEVEGERDAESEGRGSTGRQGRNRLRFPAGCVQIGLRSAPEQRRRGRIFRGVQRRRQCRWHLRPVVRMHGTEIGRGRSNARDVSVPTVDHDSGGCHQFDPRHPFAVPARSTRRSRSPNVGIRRGRSPRSRRTGNETGTDESVVRASFGRKCRFGSRGRGIETVGRRRTLPETLRAFDGGGGGRRGFSHHRSQERDGLAPVRRVPVSRRGRHVPGRGRKRGRRDRGRRVLLQLHGPVGSHRGLQDEVQRHVLRHTRGRVRHGPDDGFGRRESRPRPEHRIRRPGLPIPRPRQRQTDRPDRAAVGTNGTLPRTVQDEFLHGDVLRSAGGEDIALRRTFAHRRGGDVAPGRRDRGGTMRGDRNARHRPRHRQGVPHLRQRRKSRDALRHTAGQERDSRHRVQRHRAAHGRHGDVVPVRFDREGGLEVRGIPYRPRLRTSCLRRLDAPRKSGAGPQGLRRRPAGQPGLLLRQPVRLRRVHKRPGISGVRRHVRIRMGRRERRFRVRQILRRLRLRRQVHRRPAVQSGVHLRGLVRLRDVRERPRVHRVRRHVLQRLGERSGQFHVREVLRRVSGRERSGRAAGGDIDVDGTGPDGAVQVRHRGVQEDSVQRLLLRRRQAGDDGGSQRLRSRQGARPKARGGALHAGAQVLPQAQRHGLLLRLPLRRGRRRCGDRRDDGRQEKSRRHPRSGRGCGRRGRLAQPGRGRRGHPRRRLRDRRGRDVRSAQEKGAAVREGSGGRREGRRDHRDANDRPHGAGRDHFPRGQQRERFGLNDGGAAGWV
mmetsp:Transcript_22721/g.46077  ORF Transcript_22721/g.46077 Transcript_22721/m.46077 type:complete len:912 (-) Transcript_22721:201-2936(-)